MAKSVQEKVESDFPDFATEVASLTPLQIDDRILKMQKELEESELSKEDDGELNNAKALAKDLGQPYRDVKKAVSLKTRYLIAMLKDQGKE